MVDRNSIPTGQVQRRHASLSEAKYRDFTKGVSAFLDQRLQDYIFEKSRAKLETRICIDTAGTGIKKNVIAPMEPSEIEEIAGPLNRHACRFRQPHLLAESGERLV